MKIVPFKKEHLDYATDSAPTSATYEESLSGTIMDDNDEPVISIGLSILWPGVAEVWTFPNERIKKHGLWVSRMTKKFLMQSFSAYNLHRVQARCLLGDNTALKWLLFFGFELEGTLYGYGPDGKDYHILAIVRK